VWGCGVAFFFFLFCISRGFDPPTTQSEKAPTPLFSLASWRKRIKKKAKKKEHRVLFEKESGFILPDKEKKSIFIILLHTIERVHISFFTFLSTDDGVEMKKHGSYVDLTQGATEDVRKHILSNGYA
jgi:hypothetical protein